MSSRPVVDRGYFQRVKKKLMYVQSLPGLTFVSLHTYGLYMYVRGVGNLAGIFSVPDP